MKTYFAAFIPDGTTWAVLFADFELATQGDSLEGAFLQAQSALQGRAQAMMEDREPLPESSNLAQAKEKILSWCKAENMKLPRGTLFQLVPCDIAEPRLVRVNVSFPETVLRRIDAKAQLAGMSRSAFLARAAQAYAG